MSIDRPMLFHLVERVFGVKAGAIVWFEDGVSKLVFHLTFEFSRILDFIFVYFQNVGYNNI